MASVNKVILIGNLTREIDVKFTPKGTAVAELGLALNRSFKPEGGERREETTFVDVTLWGRTAEIAGDFVRKGHQVYVEGRLQLDTWEDKETGQKRSKLKVIGEQLTLLNQRDRSPRSGGEDDDSAPATPPPRAARQSGSRPPAEPEDDDIPF